MITPRATGWSITVIMGMGWDARAEVKDPAGQVRASARWLPSAKIAFGWAEASLAQLTEADAAAAPKATPPDGP